MRSRRAKVIHAKGEYEASRELTQAADVLSENPNAMTLRYLQTLIGIAEEKSSTIVFPLPVDLISSVLKQFNAGENK